MRDQLFQSAVATTLLGTGSKAATANATGTAVDVREYAGSLLITQTVGVITGTLDGKLQACSDAAGTGAADIAGATFTQVTTSNDDPNHQVISIHVSQMPEGKTFLRYVGTIVTGPANVGVMMHGVKKYT